MTYRCNVMDCAYEARGEDTSAKQRLFVHLRYVHDIREPSQGEDYLRKMK